jgi:uncharacterized membrane protein YqiK
MFPEIVYGVAALAGVGALLLLIRVSGVLRYIPNNRIGVVEKLWSSKSIESGLIALNGEAGYRPDVLRGGLHMFAPFQYRVHKVNLVTITNGKIGYVFARDGQALPASQTLAQNGLASDFEDTRHFLAHGGQKGPQAKILREGTYAINLAEFVVITDERLYALQLSDAEQATLNDMQSAIQERGGFEPVVIRDSEDKIGVVTVHDGPSLPPGEIIAPEVGTDATDAATYHNNFQEPEKFIAACGWRGRQLQVLVDGTYYVNRLFATVELIAKTVIDVGHVGVVVSYTGKTGKDLSGDGYRHGELVDSGFRGVWKSPLLPGKYAFNTYAGRVFPVPTTNFVLKWQHDVIGSHKLDENLAEISLITKDAFEPSLPLSVVVHIDYQKAPEVIQRFGDIKKLVEQTLDPMISAFFKDIGQQQSLIELLQQRSAIQQQAAAAMKTRFLAYSLELQEVLIGTPRAQKDDKSIERILAQLRERQIAVEQVETYKLQEVAAKQERTLNEARATAEAQTALTQSQIKIQVADNDGSASVKRAEREAQQIEVLASAQAARQRLEGDGQAAAVAAIGGANAEATEKQVKAYGGPQYRLAEQVAKLLFEAVKDGKIALVPQIQVGGEGSAASVGLLNGIMAGLLPRVKEAAASALLSAPQ